MKHYKKLHTGTRGRKISLFMDVSLPVQRGMVASVFSLTYRVISLLFSRVEIVIYS